MLAVTNMTKCAPAHFILEVSALPSQHVSERQVPDEGMVWGPSTMCELQAMHIEPPYLQAFPIK